MMFTIDNTPIDLSALRDEVLDPRCGAIVNFEGLVRNHNEGKAVESLEYDAHPTLALKEGQRVVEEALTRFEIRRAVATHRVGHLAVGDVAVAVFVSSSHRQDAFEAARWLIDEIKSRVPIWKREHFTDGTAEWLAVCPGCQHGAREQA
jgi:molybdopterin synthase catalytic subunit